MDTTQTLNESREKDVYYLFQIYYDGIMNLVEPISKLSTFDLGVTKLRYNESNQTLHVHLRRPGFLIGRGGKDFDKLKKHLKCNIEIHEVKNLWD